MRRANCTAKQLLSRARATFDRAYQPFIYERQVGECLRRVRPETVGPTDSEPEWVALRWGCAVKDNPGLIRRHLAIHWLMIPFPTSPTLQNSVMAAYASYVLPVLFGLVGTIASFLRDISNRITGSILSPRAETLAIIRIILGAIAGLAVGLFFTPTSVAAQISAGAGVLTLSASGIAFLAGYGADGFFRMIDAMITRLFGVGRSEGL